MRRAEQLVPQCAAQHLAVPRAVVVHEERANQGVHLLKERWSV